MLENYKTYIFYIFCFHICFNFLWLKTFFVVLANVELLQGHIKSPVNPRWIFFLKPLLKNVENCWNPSPILSKSFRMFCLIKNYDYSFFPNKHLQKTLIDSTPGKWLLKLSLNKTFIASLGKSVSVSYAIVFIKRYWLF